MHFKTLLSAALAVAGTFAQRDYGDGQGGGLAGLLSSQPDLSVLKDLISGFPDLLKTLNEAKDITIFAPCNKAFALLNSTGQLATLVKNEDYVKALLTYHVVHDVYEAKDFKTTPQFPKTFLVDQPTYTRVSGGQVVELKLKGSTAVVISGGLRMAKVVKADIHFGGGVIHVIGSLLSIPAKPSVTVARAQLSALADSLKVTGLVETLDTACDLTIFAPDNAAFRDLGTSLNGLSNDQIADILKYHVIVGTIGYSSILTNASFPTLLGPPVTITVRANGKVFVNAAEVVIPDILVSNGVAHVIGSVLDPKKPGPPAPCPPSKVKRCRAMRMEA